MFQLKELLNTFKSLQDPSLKRQGIADVLNEVCSISFFSSTSLEIQRNIVWLKVNPAIKQKVFMKKGVCIEVINARFPDIHIIDIK